MHLHRIIREETGNPDPYLSVKRTSTEIVWKLMPHLERLMEAAEDRLSLAIKFGALGNVIDFGTPARMDIGTMIDDVVDRDLTIFMLREFKDELKDAGTILFLGGNAGEIILDTFLLKELKNSGMKIIYGVREGPIINDATKEDALEAGIADFAELITTGSHGPGTLLEHATDDLLRGLTEADLIISKGQGNYESLSSNSELAKLVRSGTSIFYLLTIKCGIVGAYAGVPEGSTILTMQRLE